jgi:Fatty acid hydroxylase superfamily
MRGSPERAIRQFYSNAIPSEYRWWLNILNEVAVGVPLFIWASHHMSGWHFTLLPLFLILANFLEWFYHKNLMHHVMWGLKFITKEHIGEHHSMFVAGDMAIRQAKEMHAVLLAPVSLAIAYGILLIPAGLAFLLYPPVAYAWVMTGAMYLILYESLHAVYHLPVDGPFRWLRKRHELHHDPEFMQKYNYNVTLPIWDLILGTYHS